MARELPRPDPAQNTARPSHDEIARRAYEIFMERGCPSGCDLEHWLEAEAQLSGTAALAAEAGKTSRSAARRQTNGQRSVR